ncbi:MAG TPA: flagellar biosynthesis anti-sigma factor FlgM [Terracidiphilus sp.]
MEIHNNADVLKSLLNVGSSPSTQGAQPAQAAQATQKPGTQPALGGDKATVSALGAEAASAANSDVRSEKVASIKAALAAGTYNVPASAVAGKVVDSMLSGSSQS